MGPYLLGKSIEWKLWIGDGVELRPAGPYLLGKSIEWKLSWLTPRCSRIFTSLLVREIN